MRSEYWSGVGKRLLSLGKTAVDFAAPVAVGYCITKVVEEACVILEEKLRKLCMHSVINSAVSFSINLAGILILVFKPYGDTVSKCIAFGFFLASFVFWLVRMIMFIKHYGKVSLEISKSFIEEKSVYKGIEKYALMKFPLISLGYAGISIASEYVPSLKEFPRISEFVAYLVKIFWKRVSLFVGISTVYTVTVFWVLKPILVKHFS